MDERQDFREVRVLIVACKSHVVQTLRTVLGVAGIKRIVVATDSSAAIDRLSHQQFAAVFCDEHAPAVEGVSFALAARRAPTVLNPMVPIFLVCGSPRKRQVENARDTGITDVIVRPVSAATVIRKLEVALVVPRPFIKAGEFFGPDRRAGERPAFSGNDRRTRTPRKVKVSFGEIADASDPAGR